ncbi:hypothetical protein [Streptomyces litchfieldiae]|uniref:Uncharacterized protein n=1 Tax=Streptomyces litchfieldiae TaxID=3075543 RepID=A0ABU2MM27_9ACTN|nr:hypothetical protein [Streptomyces sp. DSM 44938]MDT0341978.1 hypothetical protein [Streptomyces sp. DSM 44938]
MCNYPATPRTSCSRFGNPGRQPLAASLGLLLPKDLAGERTMWALVTKFSRIPYHERAAAALEPYRADPADGAGCPGGCGCAGRCGGGLARPYSRRRTVRPGRGTRGVTR